MNVIKRNGNLETFNEEKIVSSINKTFKSCGSEIPDSDELDAILGYIQVYEDISIEEIQDQIEESLMSNGYVDEAREYILYRKERERVRKWVKDKQEFIENYKSAFNTADGTVDDNSNVSSKNIGVLNSEIHKGDNINISRGMVMNKLKELYPNFDHKQYTRDLDYHIIYKHDESSFAGAVAPYCCSITMYPFLTGGIKGIGGLSAFPQNLDSYCGMYINLIFATSAMFAGAVATGEFLLYFDYFSRKEWGDKYHLNPDTIITSEHVARQKTIRKQIRQHFQQIVYSINQPAAARGLQSAFVNFSYFDRPFFDGMFGDFYFPDGTKPIWESLSWLQKEFMMWFNEERLKTIITFPVESFALVYKDGEFLDKESAEFVAEEYSRGHSFFTYISDSVDSLSSCCRLKNKLQTKEFNFTNGNLGIQTGSKSVITLNLSRIVQDFDSLDFVGGDWEDWKSQFQEYLIDILDRVYKYHTAYNELLWDMYNSDMLPVYKAGFIDLNKQYLTIGLNGLNEAANYMDIECNINDDYEGFCTMIFNTIKEQNELHKTSKTIFNTECVPAESLAIKNYNWDKEDGYWVPKDTNLYSSYMFRPSDPNLSVLDKMTLHGNNYIGEYLDGGSASHINLEEHLSKEQYIYLLRYAAEVGCQYFTFNVPNSECQDCGFISKTPFTTCPKCNSSNVDMYDRIIGYLTRIKNWSEGRREEQKHRIYKTLLIKEDD